jgi:hypothetical protein
MIAGSVSDSPSQSLSLSTPKYWRMNKKYIMITNIHDTKNTDKNKTNLLGDADNDAYNRPAPETTIYLFKMLSKSYLFCLLI